MLFTWHSDFGASHLLTARQQFHICSIQRSIQHDPTRQLGNILTPDSHLRMSIKAEVLLPWCNWSTKWRLTKMQAAESHSDPWAHLLHKALNEVQTHEGLLCNIGAALLVLLLVSWSLLRRPRTTGSLVIAWLCWFVWQLNRGHSAWQEVLDHAQTAGERTTGAIRAVVEMLVAWVALFVPALHDLYLDSSCLRAF